MQINLIIPDNIANEIEATEFDIRMILAAKFYEDGKLSSGQCADIVGISKREFLESLGRYGVSMFSQNIDEIKADMESAGRFISA